MFCAAFESRFGESLSVDELDGFIEIARERRLLEGSEENQSTDDTNQTGGTKNRGLDSQTSSPSAQRQSILYWRKSVFDPDRFFTWLEPKVRFFWTRAFLVFSAGCILLAVLILWTGRQAVATSFVHALRWETLVLAWLVMFAIGMLHESAHGLTCKHYGGEVHEIGFLLMYFMPCFYCNVSDAWLFREKSKRLWVTFAGGYFELFLWALAVFVWRITVPDSLPNYLAFIVVVSCGIDSLFNFNPLIKLDGYYLLSDWVEIPNLRQRSFAYTMSWWRRLLWGGPRPEPAANARFLFGFGLVSWGYSLTFLCLMLLAVWYWLRDSLGVLSLIVAGGLALLSLRGLFSDIFREDFRIMISKRRRRSILWLIAVSGLIAASLIVPWTETAEGDFEVRATTHAEIRAPVAGFLRRVTFDEGERVSNGVEIARLEIPDLESQFARKQAELREAEAKLKLQKAGARAEEIAQQERRLAAAQAFRDVAAKNLERQKRVLAQDLKRFDKLLEECAAECDYARQRLDIQESLQAKNAVTPIEYAAAKKTCLTSCAKRAQVEADREARAALSTSIAESELAEREKELAHEQAVLALLEAGTRPEEIEAAQANRGTPPRGSFVLRGSKTTSLDSKSSRRRDHNVPPQRENW